MRSFLYLFLVGILIYGCSKTEAVEPAAPPAPVAPAPIPEIGELNLELPENNKTCETGTISLDKADVEFKWKAAPNATKYEIQVTDVLDNKSIKFSDVTGTSKTISLTRGKNYTWNIVAANAGSKTVASAQWKFYLSGDGKANRAPTAAKAIYPVPGSTIILNAAGAVKFEWLAEDADKDVLSYSIRIDTMASNQKLSGNSFDTKTPLHEIKLPVGKIYYWYVIANDGSISIKSDVFSFKLK
jgi:hypothetical protein